MFGDVGDGGERGSGAGAGKAKVQLRNESQSKMESFILGTLAEVKNELHRSTLEQ